MCAASSHGTSGPSRSTTSRTASRTPRNSGAILAQFGAIILRRRLLYRYVLLDLRHSPPYDESFVGYGKDRVSYTYELAARRVAFEVQPEIFAIHYTTVTRGAKKAYGHSPVDWMVGETCWPAFRSRVKQAYRFDTTSCAQDATDRQVRRRYGCAAAGGEARCCVSEAEGLCVCLLYTSPSPRD